MLENFRTREFSKDEARRLNPLQLALVGDAVYEVFIRSYILSNNVKAKSQSDVMHDIEELLNEEEKYIYKRGRNAKSATVPKNADVRDYRMATGFEALVGYLYLINDKERLEFVFNNSIEVCSN